MTRLASRTCLAALVVLSGCDVLRTNDSENVPGRGAQAFDPYQAAASGAIRLSLQQFNGCSILASGAPVQRGEANIPYPANCENPRTGSEERPAAVMELVAETNYFLNQLTLMDELTDVHNDPADMSAPLTWMRKASRFRSLDWRDVAVRTTEWTGADDLWISEVFFDNAMWMRSKDDVFRVEVLDAAGEVRGTVEYSRNEFLAQTPVTGHTRASWRREGTLPPRYPGDVNPPASPRVPAAMTRTVMRVDLVGSINPFKSINIPKLRGDGALRVTWSLMPNEPFYFPVRFVEQAAVPFTCFDADDQAVQCGFGLAPQIHLTQPKNGAFYEPGETFDVLVDIQDAQGNRLHPRDRLPSYADFYSNKSNGLLYYQPGHDVTMLERDITSAIQVAGPLDKLRPRHDMNLPVPYFVAELAPIALAGQFASRDYVPGMQEAPWPTHFPITLPQDAEPGTYVVSLKAHRQYLGERTSRTVTATFQVKQAEPTDYPNRVGNCQICHRGVISMENVQHGMSVDHVEACKTCHVQDERLSTAIHQIHANSPKYPRSKADCTVCHLTRESALRPSLEVCGSCHPSTHGSEYFAMRFAPLSTVPNRFGNCAQACHVVETTPSSHLLPPEGQ